jgi:hypothetical protein
MTLVLLGLTVAHSQSIAIPPASEEVVVFGDPFARWDDTRWLLQTEWVHPLGVELLADDNLGFEAAGLRMNAVIACDIDGRLGQNQREVLCQIEDVALQGVAVQRQVPDGTIETVLEQIDGKLTGAMVQLQVNARGGVFDVDLEGVPARNERQRRSKEQIRQIVRRLVAPMHLSVQPGEKWMERNSMLMTMPSHDGTAGSSSLAHHVGQADGQWVLQTTGEGVAMEDLYMKKMVRDPHGMRWVFKDVLIGTGGWHLETSGVGLVDPELGYVTERVYATTGEALASSMIVNGEVWHHGSLRLLGTDDRPALGPTGPGVRQSDEP